MRAKTKKKHEMGRRFAIVIGAAAAGVMALGAQTGAQTQAPTPRGQAPPTCMGLAATIVGTKGPDTVGYKGPDNLRATRGRDVIVTLGGNDFTHGRGGNDVICGGKGEDFLSGGHGKDRLFGQAGRDCFCNPPAPPSAYNKDRCNGGKGTDSTYPVCEVEKSIERSGFFPPMFH